MSDSRSKRVQRVERELLETLSQFALQGLSEPLPCFASVSAVEVSPDLRNAKVFFRLVGGEQEVAVTKEILQRERAEFQKHVAQELSLKFCPVLRFEFGVAPQLDEVDQLFEKLRKPRFGFGD